MRPGKSRASPPPPLKVLRPTAFLRGQGWWRGTTFGWGEAAAVSGLLALVAAGVFIHYIVHAGFNADDWALSAIYKFGLAHGVLGNPGHPGGFGRSSWRWTGPIRSAASRRRLPRRPCRAHALRRR